MNLSASHNSTAFFNGEYLPLEDIKISPFDRGYLFGDCIYEAIPAYNQVPLGSTEHFQRLNTGLAEIGIESPYTVEQWAEKIAPLFVRINPVIYRLK